MQTGFDDDGRPVPTTGFDWDSIYRRDEPDASDAAKAANKARAETINGLMNFIFEKGHSKDAVVRRVFALRLLTAGDTIGSLTQVARILDISPQALSALCKRIAREERLSASWQRRSERFSDGAKKGWQTRAKKGCVENGKQNTQCLRAFRQKHVENFPNGIWES